MPTPTGLPKVGERWRRTMRLPKGRGEWETHVYEFTVIARSRGDYWSLKVREDDGKIRSILDGSYSMSRGELTYVG